MSAKLKVPNQRTILVNKKECNEKNLYTVNNLSALDEAAFRLQSKGGFKLYMYISKNQNKYYFCLSSSDFMHWSGLGYTAYKTAFEELVSEGYLVLKEHSFDEYIFYDKSIIDDETVIIYYPNKEKEEMIVENTGFIF